MNARSGLLTDPVLKLYRVYVVGYRVYTLHRDVGMNARSGPLIDPVLKLYRV